VKKLGLGSQAVKVKASVLGSGKHKESDEPDISERISRIAYETSGLGPKNIDLAEVHDATAFGEMHQAEALGFCRKGDGGIFAESGTTQIGGKLPINTSGGLESRGHPIGASGLAQIHEMVVQLRGAAGKRQVKNARIAMTENGGGGLGDEEAAMCIHIFEAPSKYLNPDNVEKVQKEEKMVKVRYMTPEWLDEIVNVYNSDPKNAETFSALSTTLSFKIKAKSDWGIEKDVIFGVKLDKGDLKWIRFLSEDEAMNGDFVVSAGPEIWKKIIRGETGFITAVMSLKLKIEHGTKHGLLILAPYSKPLLNLMGKVELQFPDEMSRVELEGYRNDVERYCTSLGI